MAIHEKIANPPIYKVPPEILLQIASYLAPHGFETALTEEMGETLWGGIHRRWSQQSDYLPKARDLRHLALTSRLFRDVAQDQLFHSVWVTSKRPTLSGSEDAIYLLRTLLDRPDLAFKVRNLGFQTGMENSRDAIKLSGSKMIMQRKLEPNMHATNPSPWVGGGHPFRDNKLRPESVGDVWYLVLAALPRLERLEVTCEISRPKKGVIEHLIPPSKPRAPASPQMPIPVGLHNLRYLRITAADLFKSRGFDRLPNLKELDVEFDFQTADDRLPSLYWSDQDDSDEDVDVYLTQRLYYTDQWKNHFQHIETLHLDCRIRGMTQKLGNWLEAMASFVPTFTSLHTLRAYGEDKDYDHSRDDCIGGYNKKRFFHWYKTSYPRAIYQHLIYLIHYPSNIKSLTLPAGFWALCREEARDPTDFSSLTSLEHLSVPRAALLGSPAVPYPDYWQFAVNEVLGPYVDELDACFMFKPLAHHGMPEDTGPYCLEQRVLDTLPRTLKTLNGVVPHVGAMIPFEM